MPTSASTGASRARTAAGGSVGAALGAHCFDHRVRAGAHGLDASDERHQLRVLVGRVELKAHGAGGRLRIIGQVLERLVAQQVQVQERARGAQQVLEAQQELRRENARVEVRRARAEAAVVREVHVDVECAHAVVQQRGDLFLHVRLQLPGRRRGDDGRRST